MPDVAPSPLGFGGDEPTPLERALGLITEVRRGEAGTALLFTLNIFLLLTAYYIIKPVREGLILRMEGGAEYKSYLSGAIAVALLFAVPAYAAFANRVSRNRLVVGVTLFFAANLAIFYVASAFGAVETRMGYIFFVWVGIFNMMVVAQMWAFANDVYTEEQGKRLFVLVGLGASVGAAAGGVIVKALEGVVGLYEMMLIGGALLVVVAVLSQVIHVREDRRASAAVDGPSAPDATAPAGDDRTRRGAFRLVLSSRFLIAVAVFSLVFTFVNTNGEYMFGKLLSAWANEEAKTQGLTGAAATAAVGKMIGSRFNDFFLYVNVCTLLLQSLAVSRIVRYLGLRIAFFIFPVIALLGATAVALVPIFAVVRISKTVENSTDYSLNNTLRNILWLPTTRDMKYKAKQAVDTFFVRMGDVSSALSVLLLTAVLALPVRAFAVVNVALCFAWMLLATVIVRRYGSMVESRVASSDGRASKSAIGVADRGLDGGRA